MTHRFATPLALVLLAAGAVPGAAQSGPLGPPLTARIDSVFRRFAVSGSPGCALGVAKDGSMAYRRGYGLASVELGVPITLAVFGTRIAVLRDAGRVSGLSITTRGLRGLRLDRISDTP